MELKDFIKQALSDIVGATDELNKEFKEKDISARVGINPAGDAEFNIGNTRITTMVKFDLTVTDTNEQGVKAGLTVFSGIIGSGVSGKEEKQNTTANTISFGIPLTFTEDR